MNVKDLKQLDEDASMDISIMVRFGEMVIVGSIDDCYKSHKKSKKWDENTPIEDVIKVYLAEHDFIEVDTVYDGIESITIDSIDE